MFKKGNNFSTIIFFILPLMYVPSYYQSNPISFTLSPRVGESIDQYERSYFGLFPKIISYDSARAFQINEKSFSINIYRSLEKDTTIDLNQSEFSSLQKYIDGYETISSNYSEGYFPNYDDAFIRLVQRKIIHPEKIDYNAEPNEFVIKQMNGKKLVSKIFFATDSNLILGSPDLKLNNPLFELLAYYVDIKNIDTIKYESSSGIKSIVYPFLITTGAVAAAIFIAGDPPHQSREGTDYKEYFSIIGTASITAGFISAFIGGIIHAIYSASHTYSIHGNIDQYKKYLANIKNDSMYPDKAPPEIFHVLQNRKGKN